MTSLSSTKETATHEFFMPVGKAGRIWGVIFSGIFTLMCIAGFVFIFQAIKTKPEKAMVFGISALLPTFMLISIFSVIRDRFQYQEQVGVQFTNDWVYLHRLLGKMKIHWNDVKKVSFSPPVLTNKDPSKRRAYMQIQSSKKTYTMLVPDYEAIMTMFQERKIKTSVHRWKVPVYAVGFFISMNNLRPLGAIIIGYLLMTSYFSKNRILSRRSELLTLTTGLIAIVTLLLLVGAPIIKK